MIASCANASGGIRTIQQRLLTALGIALLAGIGGAGVALWLKSNHMLGIVMVTILIGFGLGLAFKFRVV